MEEESSSKDRVDVGMVHGKVSADAESSLVGVLPRATFGCFEDNA